MDEIVRRSKTDITFNIEDVERPGINQVEQVTKMKTNVKKMSEAEFDLVHQHGYEVADTTMFCHSSPYYASKPYDLNEVNS